MNEITSDIPREVEEVLIDIKYVAGLPPGKKYDISSKSYVNANSIVSKAYRTYLNASGRFTNEDRSSAFSFINKTITTAIGIAKKHPRWKSLLCEEVTKMGSAVTNLEHVYHDDPIAVGRISTIGIRVGHEAFMNACGGNANERTVFVERDPDDD